MGISKDLEEVKLEWKEVSAEEAARNEKYGFGGALVILYAIVCLWCLHNAYILVLDSNYDIAKFYGYENFTIIDFTAFVQIVLALPFLYLAPKLDKEMQSISVSCFLVNLGCLFVFGVISPLAVEISIVFVVLSLAIVIYLARSERVNLTYRNRVPAG